MSSRDWDFAIGELGNPLADIKDWMLLPFPAWMPEWQQRGELAEHHINKENQND